MDFLWQLATHMVEVAVASKWFYLLALCMVAYVTFQFSYKMLWNRWKKRGGLFGFVFASFFRLLPMMVPAVFVYRAAPVEAIEVVAVDGFPDWLSWLGWTVNHLSWEYRGYAIGLAFLASLLWILHTVSKRAQEMWKAVRFAFRISRLSQEDQPLGIAVLNESSPTPKQKSSKEATTHNGTQLPSKATAPAEASA